MVTNDNQISCGDHFVMYRNIKSLCCAPGTNMVFQATFQKQTSEQTISQKKRSDLQFPEAGGRGEETG